MLEDNRVEDSAAEQDNAVEKQEEVPSKEIYIKFADVYIY